MSLTYAIEPLEKCWPEMIRLAEAHWCETEGYRHGQKFAPSFARYKQCEEIGYYAMFIARDGDKIAGYAGMYITQSMHTQRIIAVEDTWFLLPEYRKGRNAIEFYRFVEAEMKRRFVVEISMTAKLTNSAGRILEYLDYLPVAMQYSKHIARADSAHDQPAAVMEKSNVRAESPAPA